MQEGQVAREISMLLSSFWCEIVDTLPCQTNCELIRLGLWPKLLSKSIISRTFQTLCIENKLKNKSIDITRVSVDRTTNPHKQTTSIKTLVKKGAVGRTPVQKSSYAMQGLWSRFHWSRISWGLQHSEHCMWSMLQHQILSLINFLRTIT